MSVRTNLDRRAFVSGLSMTAAGLLTACSRGNSQSDLDAYLVDKMERSQIPGLAAAIIRYPDVVWSKGYGWADIDRGVEMTLDTIQNIGSISKTFVGTAIMQLKESGDLALEDDVNRFIDFPLRNPSHPDRSVTILDLLTHKSSIADGSAYSRGYACGDPTVPLDQWIRGYFESDGVYFNAPENFHAWAPGDRGEYNNLAFGLLAYLVEVISALPFEQYCRTRIFEPIGMVDTSWYLSGVDTSRHAIPYSYVTNDEIRGPTWGGTAQRVVGAENGAVVSNGHAPNCLYNHPNFPDGFLRTSVHQLAKYQLAYLNGGALDGKRILSESSVREMLSPLFPTPDRPGLEQGLVWWRRELPSGDFVWEHAGGDPGINTIFSFDPSSGHGVIVFANTWGAQLREASDRLLQEL